MRNLSDSPIKRIYKKPNPGEARRIAFALVTQVNREGAYANLRLPQLLSDSTLDQRDRSFVTELAYGTLRMQGKHDYAISKFIDRDISQLDSSVLDLLRLGVHQLTEMRVSDHAAVSETVELARAVAGESKATYINAILRKVSSDSTLFDDVRSKIESNPKYALSILYSHPEWIVSAFFDLLKNWGSVEKALAANNEPVAPNLIAWPGKSTREELLSLGGSALKIGRSSILADRMPTEYPAIRERRAGVQDCGSQLLTEIFFETAKEINSRNLDWLDLCAGPGGKAAYLQALISTERSSDTFTANEPSEHRAKLVQSVVNLKNVISLDGRNASEFPGKYDRILVDAPCSGLGALRRRPEARWRKNLSDLKGLIELQRDLLDSAYTLLKPGGIVGYATCSPHLLETKGQVLDFAHRHKEATQISISIADTGIEGAINSDENMQLWTHVQKSDSMFLALFQKPE